MTLLIVLAFLALALIGTPLFMVFGASAMYLFVQNGGTAASVAVDVFSEKFADSPQLVTIPLFTIAGYIMAEGGTPNRLIALSRAWLGWMPGGLAIVCLCTSAFFTTFTGGSGITIVAIGGLLMPALLKERYPERFSLGLVTAAGSLGIMFPPALPLILYGIVANILIDKLFLAGFLPGVLTVIALSAYSSWVGVKSKVERVPFNLQHALKTTWHAKWEIGLPIVIVGGLATGKLRVHESSAFTGLYVLLVETLIYRELSIRRDLPRIIRESMTLVGAILAILSTAIGFTAFLIQVQVPAQLLEMMQVFITSKTMFLLVLNVFLLIAGMVMEIFGAIFVVVPLIAPIGKHFGVDPYHLAIMFLVNLEIAYLAPPLGLNLIISSFRFGTPVTNVYRAVLPFIAVLTVTLLVTTYVPWLSTYLPSLSKQKDLTREEMGESPSPTGEDGAFVPDDDGATLDDLDSINLDDLGVPADADGGAAVAPTPAAEPAEAAPAEPAAEPESAPAEDNPSKSKKKKQKR